MDNIMMPFQSGPSYADRFTAYDCAQDLADANETPVGVWERDGWFFVSEVAPDGDDDDPRVMAGFEMIAVADPLEDAI